MNKNTEAYFDRILRSVTVAGVEPSESARCWSRFCVGDLVVYVVPIENKPRLSGGEWFDAAKEVGRLLTELHESY